MATVLSGTDVSVHFGGLKALDRVNIELDEDEFVGLVGPNGAGKTTMLEVLSGRLQATSGTVLFRGEDVTSWRSWRLARAGLVRTFQANKLFESRTVHDHIMLGLQAANGPSALKAFLSAFTGSANRSAEITQLADQFRLSDVLFDTADELPFGKQRLLGIAMSVAACSTLPGVLLLDEPLAGMNDVEMGHALTIFGELRAQGFAILMIEHNMAAVSQAADRLYVLENGKNLAEGLPDVVLKDPAVMTAYLGADLDESPSSDREGE